MILHLVHFPSFEIRGWVGSFVKLQTANPGYMMRPRLCHSVCARTSFRYAIVIIPPQCSLVRRIFRQLPISAQPYLRPNMQLAA